MKATTYTLSMTALLLLGGCGGGGGSSSDSAPAAVQPPPVVAEAPADPQPAPQTDPQPDQGSEELVVETTSDLVADSTFSLSSHKKVTVNVDISGMSNNQGYLSICAVTSAGTPDYEDCYLRTALPDASHQSELLVATNTTEVISAIWFLDLSAQPVITSHDLANNELTLTL